MQSNVTRLPNHQHQKNCNMAEIHFKFVPQQTVWVMYENRPVEAEVISVRISIEHHSLPTKIEYGIMTKNGLGAKYSEESIFATREELKQSIFG